MFTLNLTLYFESVCACGVDDPGPETKALTELGFVGGDRYGSREY